jgi:hypothetical protein
VTVLGRTHPTARWQREIQVPAVPVEVADTSCAGDAPGGQFDSSGALFDNQHYVK